MRARLLLVLGLWAACSAPRPPESVKAESEEAPAALPGAAPTETKGTAPTAPALPAGAATENPNAGLGPDAALSPPKPLAPMVAPSAEPSRETKDMLDDGLSSDDEKPKAAKKTTGSAYGIVGGRAAAGTEVDAGRPSVSGSLEMSVVQRVMKGAMPGVKSCYKSALEQNANLEAKLTASVRIRPDGSVSEAKISGNAPPGLSECVSLRLKKLVFPEPSDGGEVSVTFPFLFQSAGE